MSKRRTASKPEAPHHPWCKSNASPADCRQCVDLMGLYPFLPGETSDQATARYFPQLAAPAAIVEPSRELVLLSPGIPIEREVEPAPKLPAIKEDPWYSYRSVSKAERASRVADEIERVELTRTRKIKEFTRRTDYVVLETDGHRRGVQRVKTTASKLETAGKLPKDLMVYVQAFAMLVANGMGAATDDRHDSTNRLTANYEGGSGGAFGSRTPSDRVLMGTSAYQEMRQRIPQELLPLFEQIVNEEVAGYSPLARTLKEIGEALGYTDRLSSASGGTQVFCISALIAHFLREKGLYTRTRGKIALEA